MYLFQAETHITLCGCTWFLCATDWFIYRSLTLYSRTGLQVMSCCHCYFSTEHFPHCSHFPAWITFQNEFLFWLWTSSRKKWDFCTIMKAKDSGLFVHRIFFFFFKCPLSILNLFIKQKQFHTLEILTFILFGLRPRWGKAKLQRYKQRAISETSQGNKEK